MLDKILKEIFAHKNKEKNEILSRFFKTGKGQYGEGDKFLGITVPTSRKIAQKYTDISLSEISKLLKNEYHEVHLIALLILVQKYKRLKSHHRSDLWENEKNIVDFYLKNTKYINNWDLVDVSAHYILGDYLLDKKPKNSSNFEINQNILEKLAISKNLWERRISIISTFAFIYKGDSKLTFKITKILLKDKHDLIHKACGWMLREVGKRVSENELTLFLNIYGSQMSRTMLRYAIERLSEDKRQYYLDL